MKDATDITVVLDRSGSMVSVAADTIGGFNKFLEDQKAVPSPATFTLAQFNHEYEVVSNGVNIQDAKPLSAETFVPRGNTALLDAIGRSINSTGARLSATPEPDRPNKVVFVILTDGEENSSKEFDSAKIAAMIDEQQKKWNWQFVFLGANQDAIATASRMNINPANAMTYAHNAGGTRAAYASTGSNVSKFRTSGVSAALNFSGSDKDAQAAAGLTN